MPGIVALVSAISTDVNAALVAAALPPLSDGLIVIGKGKSGETSAPPRVIFTPVDSDFSHPARPNRNALTTAGSAQSPGAGLLYCLLSNFGSGYTSTPAVSFSAPQLSGGTTATAVAVAGPLGAIKAIALTNAGSGYTAAPAVTISGGGGSGATANATLGQSAELLIQISQRPLFTERVHFSALVWGAATPNDPNFDYDATQVLYHQVIRSSWLLAPGIMSVTALRWLDADEQAMQIDLLGHAAQFDIYFDTPVLDYALGFAPPGVQPFFTGNILPFGGEGTPEQGFQG